MNLHEYQAKQLFAEYGIPVPRGMPAKNAGEAVNAAQTLGGSLWVVKAQVHAGGRGKAGGVKLCRSTAEVRAATEGMIGKRLHTHQTGPEGLPINAVIVEAGSDIERELYLSVLVDRAREQVVFMASAAGGMDIEEVAAKTPEKIFRVWIHPAAGIQPNQVRELAFGLGLTSKEHMAAFGKIAEALYKLFMERDVSLVEINPLIVTKDGRVLALDAKLNLDDNAMYRQPKLAALRDASQEDERESLARQHDLNYVSLDGDIACMVNGAGLAMATMDIIKYAGGSPANFLDVGGGANAEQVKNAFRILLTDKNVKAVLINIFGGILRCDTLATGVVAAARDLNIQVPIVVRMEGTNVELGRKILAESGLNFTVAENMRDAAEKVVRLSN